MWEKTSMSDALKVHVLGGGSAKVHVWDSLIDVRITNIRENNPAQKFGEADLRPFEAGSLIDGSSSIGCGSTFRDIYASLLGFGVIVAIAAKLIRVKWTLVVSDRENILLR
jgi:hypothetical protein